MRIFLFLLLLPALLFASIGNVAAVKGSVVIQRHAKSIPAKYGTAIEEKDTIVTRNNSKIQIILKDETIVTIGKNSSYTFKAYRFHTKKDSEATMKLHHGFFRVITGKIGKIAPEHFKVEGKSATIGIRGTHFYGLVRSKVEEYGCIHGRISLLTRSAGKVSLVAGEMMTLKNHLWKRGSIGKGRVKVDQKSSDTATDTTDETAADRAEQASLPETSFGSTSVPSGSDQVQQGVLMQESHHTAPQPPPQPPHPHPPYPTGAVGGSNRGM